MLKKKKTTASGKLVLVKSVRRTRSHRMKFCVQRGLGALPSTSKRRGKSRRDFLLCGPVCINTGIACKDSARTVLYLSKEKMTPSFFTFNYLHSNLRHDLSCYFYLTVIYLSYPLSLIYVL